MSTVHVDAEWLRTAGKDLVDAREELTDSKYAEQLGGMEDHTRVSTGGFGAGQRVQDRLYAHNGRMMEVFGGMQINLMALSSSLHIVADVFESADHENAFKFAFVDPEAATPDGLPFYIDPDATYESLVEEQEADEPTDPDDEPDPTEVPEGGRQVTRNLNLPFTRFEPDLPDHFVTETYDADDNLVSTQHRIVSSDGSTTYYTEIHHDDGSTERVDEMEFGPQGRPADMSDPAGWANEELDIMTEHPNRAPQPE